jgi:cell wall-associated NlpC family hydrolase
MPIQNMVKYLYKPVNTRAHQYLARHQQRMVVLLAALTLLLSGCHSMRQTSRGGLSAAEQVFYAEQSALLGFRLQGTEDPVLLWEVTSWMGTPYRFGGNSRQGADCSGFVQQVYRSVYDYSLPRSADEMARYSSRLRQRRLNEGDLVFFRTKRRKISHVGIYLGQGYFIHVSTSRGVMVNHLDETYYSRTFAYGGG